MRSKAGLVALLVLGCRTHEVPDCRVACDDDDVASFAACVANGTSGCLAGNRRCCALAQQCVGALDDQTVFTTATDCAFVTETSCWPPCDGDDQATYETCVAEGSASCSIDDFECCALEADCLGDLGDVIVTADGCCADSSECALDEVCDPGTWTCEIGSAVCGDRMMSGSEACDDGNTVTESCSYGVRSCDVCTDRCTLEPGATSFCGDGSVDGANGEDCEPPGTRVCDASCDFTGTPAHCSDGVVSGNETDRDCGGSCAGCAPFERCLVTADCRVVTLECSPTVTCDPSKFLCFESFGCDDGMTCTDDVCTVGVGCEHPMLDRDMDGFGPLDLGCGTDCDDFLDTVNPRVMFDMGCSSGTPGFNVDEDCDTFVDEDC